ncbi:MAG: hypothetical protein ACRDYC_09285, partial [Acidimicrobiales bacterium]
MSRSPWRAAALGCLLIGCVTGCTVSPSASSAPTLPPVATALPTTTTLPRPSTTTSSTTVVPSKPQSSDASAAEILVAAWASDNTAEADTVALPTAVSTLFAIQYPVNNLQDLGCTDIANPATCSYRNTQSGALYEIE